MGLIAKKRATKAIARQGSASHALASKHERQVATRLRGDVVARSGAGVKKGDIQIKGLARIECKGTVHASFSITKNMLAKNDSAALNAGEIPVVVVQFLTPTGGIEDEQAVIRLADLEELIHRCQPR